MATSLSNLARLYYAQGRYSKAEPLYIRALEIFCTRLGNDHPNTQTVLSNFATFLQAVIAAGKVGQLSSHPFTQGLLQSLQNPQT